MHSICLSRSVLPESLGLTGRFQRLLDFCGSAALTKHHEIRLGDEMSYAFAPKQSCQVASCYSIKKADEQDRGFEQDVAWKKRQNVDGYVVARHAC